MNIRNAGQKMKPLVPLFSQELPTSCVAACVRMVLASLGHLLTEADIRQLCGHTSAGMRLNQIAYGLRGLSVAVDYRIGWVLEDLIEAVQRDVSPIIGIDLRPVEGIFAFHAVVVSDIASDQIVVHDPLYQQGPRSIGLATFETAWHSADSEAVIISA
jgi:ABC-type bacteriocin/lantibiotic exporter with double-glycine peptidase domain